MGEKITARIVWVTDIVSTYNSIIIVTLIPN